MKTKYQTIGMWTILAMTICVASTGLIAATSYLTNRGYDLPPWF